jgi:uncharacterized membrane protein YfcA
VSALSPPAGAALAAVLLASMARAFFGPPAVRPRRRVARALLAATAACYLAGAALVVLAGATLPGAVLVVCGIEASCVGAWLIRGPRDDDDDDGGGGGPDGPESKDPPPWDWDAFDRARAAWHRRPRAGV